MADSPNESDTVTDTVAVTKYATNDANVTSTLTSLSKKEKGRFKKLRKRLDHVVAHQNVSGFISSNDCVEWQDLCSTNNISSNNSNSASSNGEIIPQFVWRQGCEQGRRTEGAHHRDVLFCLLLSDPPSPDDDDNNNDNNEELTKQGKKRARPGTSSHVIQQMSKYKSLPSWLCLHNPATIQHVGVLEVHLDTRDQLDKLQSALELALGHRSHLVAPTRWFTGSHVKCMSDALLFATPPKKKSSTNKTDAGLGIQNLPQLIEKLQSFELSREEMKQFGYPLPQEESTSASPPDTTATTTPQGWIVSPAPVSNGDSGCKKAPVKLWALDCEMVETTEGRALARFTLLEATHYNVNAPQDKDKLQTRVALDTLVQPKHRVTNYLTEFSGVTAQLLEQGPTLNLAELQQKIVDMVKEQDVLVGHSLENDLQVSQWIHLSCVDTAVLFSHPQQRAFKYKLRHLSQLLLKRTIQQAHQSHCSEEDAQAALDLAVGRAVKGDDFGPKDTRSMNKWSTLAKTHDVVAAVGPGGWLNKYITNPPNAAHALAAETFSDTNLKALQSFLTAGKNRKAQLIWGQVKVTKEEHVTSCRDLVQQLLTCASREDTIFLIALQCSYSNVQNEFHRRKTLSNPKTTQMWQQSDEDAFQKDLEDCRLGTAIWVGGDSSSRSNDEANS